MSCCCRDDLAAPRGIRNGVWISILAWAALALLLTGCGPVSVDLARRACGFQPQPVAAGEKPVGPTAEQEACAQEWAARSAARHRAFLGGVAQGLAYPYGPPAQVTVIVVEDPGRLR